MVQFIVYKGSNKVTALEFLKQHPVNRMGYFIVVETPEGNYCRDLYGFFKEDTGNEITENYLKWYADRIAKIPDVFEGTGTTACQEIGQEIYDKWGHEGMVNVCEYIRDNLYTDVDSQHPKYALDSSVGHIWRGIGEWSVF